MRVKSLCTAVMILGLVSVGHCYADQKIKTKSNIKNDRIAQPVASSECAEKCAESEQCVKPLATDSDQAEVVKAYCALVSEEKSSASAKKVQ